MKYLMGAIFFLLSYAVFGQVEPVKWTIQAEKINDEEYKVSLTADIDHGWSIYSQEVSEDLGPIPTQLKIEENAGVQLISEIQESGMKKEAYDAVFGVSIPKFQRKARFSQIVKVEPDTTMISGQLTFMTCDATSCLPPADFPFQIDLEQ